MRSVAILLAVAGLLAGCGHGRLAGETGALQRPSPNHDERRPNFVILHQTSNDAVEPALRTLTDPERRVSAHYLIGRDGRLFQLVDERRRAWHAGVSRWGALTDLNSASIGIELDNNGDEPFPDAQIETLLRLLADVTARWNIPAANVLAHGDIAPGRKVDPSRHFPWRRLAAAGFGAWCEQAPPAPVGFNVEAGLAGLGYDLRDPVAASLAFRRHFAGDDASAELTPQDQAMLACLLLQRSREAP